MMLLIDIGNTNTVCALYDGENYSTTNRINLDDDPNQILSLFLNCNIISVAISSVVPTLTKIYTRNIKKIFNIMPFIISYKNANLKLAVESAKEVGNDRICNAKAAISLTQKNCIIVDFGTATTYDVINKNGEFLGGAIAPGIDVSAEHLIKKAALLNDAVLEFPKKIIGKNTKTNIQSGVMYSAIYSIEGMIKNINEELEIESHVILTGGFSKLISPKLSFEHNLESNLTLEGIRLIYEENK